LKNFISLFSDPGADFETGSLDYELAGDLKDIHQILLQKRDGRFYLVLWQGVESSRYTDKDADIADIEHEPAAVTVKLKKSARRATLYNPSFSMKVVKQYESVGGGRSVRVPVADHIAVLELTP